MRKLNTVLAIAFIVVTLSVIIVSLLLDRAVKAGIETLGPEITDTSVTVEKVGISLLSGKGEMKGLVIGNPEGYKTESALRLGSVKVSIDINTILSDRIVIKEVVIDGPDITYETSATGNNISQIMRNIESSGDGDKGKDSAKSKKEKGFQINDLIIRNGKIRLGATTEKGEALKIALPDMHLKNIGKGSNGITARALAGEVFGSFHKGIITAVAGSGGYLGETLKDTSKKVGEGVSNFFKGIKDAFK